MAGAFGLDRDLLQSRSGGLAGAAAAGGVGDSTVVNPSSLRYLQRVAHSMHNSGPGSLLPWAHHIAAPQSRGSPLFADDEELELADVEDMDLIE